MVQLTWLWPHWHSCGTTGVAMAPLVWPQYIGTAVASVTWPWHHRYAAMALLARLWQCHYGHGTTVGAVHPQRSHSPVSAVGDMGPASSEGLAGDMGSFGTDIHFPPAMPYTLPLPLLGNRLAPSPPPPREGGTQGGGACSPLAPCGVLRGLDCGREDRGAAAVRAGAAAGAGAGHLLRLWHGAAGPGAAPRRPPLHRGGGPPARCRG